MASKSIKREARQLWRKTYLANLTLHSHSSPAYNHERSIEAADTVHRQYLDKFGDDDYEDSGYDEDDDEELELEPTEDASDEHF